MSEYVPEEGSLSAALLAEVANGQASDLRVARARGTELAEEWARGLADGQGRHVPARRMWPELAALLDALVDGADR